MINRVGHLGLAIALAVGSFAHAQNNQALPHYEPADLSASQLQGLQRAVSAAEGATTHTLQSKQWQAGFAKELSPEQWQRKREAYNRQLSQLFSSAPSAAKASEADADEDSGPRLAGEQLVLFVSSSMPLHTLRAYARDLAQVGGVMVVRGGIGGLRQVTPTMNWIHSVLSVKADCEGECKMWATELLIDPMLFRLYGIKKVPALIYQPDMKISAYCDGLDKAQKAAAVVYCDARLMGLVDELNKETPSETLTQLSKILWKKQ
jgi:type-F conjugative transfer system pilin assembly protein TrbC